jgi:hypothetical protein
MFLRQITDSALAQNAYLIGCQRSGEAIIVDPERDIDRYLDLAAENSFRIVAVAETHIHADYLSGARELVERHGAIAYLSEEGGPDGQFEWAKGNPNARFLHDGDTFRVGNIELKALLTAGHTPEHLRFLVTDIGGGADTAAGLDPDVDGAGEVSDQGVLDRAAGLGTVEIDDVGPACARCGEGGEAGGGLVIVAGDRVEPAMHQPHADPVLQVDGGIDDHAGSSRKFLRMRAPVAAERSG